MAITPLGDRRPIWIAILGLLALPATGRANVGPPYSGGQLTADPVGIKDVAIEREELTINLRPLAEVGRARVEAVYHLNNAGAERKLDLLFASGSADVAEFRVMFDDRPVPSSRAPSATLPESWKAPKATPALDGDSPLQYPLYHARAVTPVAFAVVVPEGRHTLKVTYAADAGTHLDGYPTVYRQFAYVLAPARSWAGFGGLDVTVHVPDGWRAAATPELTRDGDTLSGHFSDVPADSIALTIQAPAGPAYWPVVCGTLGLFGLAILGGAFVCWRAGRAKGRALARSPDAGHAWPRSVVVGLAWGVVVLGTGLLATFAPDWILPSGHASHYGYGQPLAMIGEVLLAVILVPIGIAIAQLTAVVVRRQWTAVGEPA
ncbi:MAG TPA: hypothetical protein VKE40_23585 [Gemmataceae bacterium]|nr:hypothetical protein [Gemmataceae bacterium]